MLQTADYALLASCLLQAMTGPRLPGSVRLPPVVFRVSGWCRGPGLWPGAMTIGLGRWRDGAARRAARLGGCGGARRGVGRCACRFGSVVVPGLGRSGRRGCRCWRGHAVGGVEEDLLERAGRSLCHTRAAVAVSGWSAMLTRVMSPVPAGAVGGAHRPHDRTARLAGPVPVTGYRARPLVPADRERLQQLGRC